MSVTIEKKGLSIARADQDDLEKWDDLVEKSPHTNVFHYRESLAVQAEHADAKLHPLIGYKGQEPVGIFPVFEKRKGGMTMAFSPAPELWVSYLGPAMVNCEKLKHRKAERRAWRFVEGCLDWIDRELGPKYTQIRPDASFRDVRPFEWNDFDIQVRHTYAVDLTPGEEDVLMAFSSDARGNIRTEGDFRVYEGGTDEIEAIISQVQSRHDEQDKDYGVTPAFVTDLYEHLPDGAVRPYALEADGEIAGGMVALEFGDTIYRWQGGAKHRHELPVNDLVDWKIMTDAMDRGVETYDLVGANERRLCEYKAKFGPELRSYYSMGRGTRVTNALSSVYKRFK
ncbi:lipid II:glycine glycyltransferase FemX [Halorussus halophilus]|uniref:lipid II:glycine glycyltransferase FemX n=1 Tax=Halorussus halophilus TaxID=2650975 RepID=UPI001300FF43|nr:GNAT family N-acetyltransferase [Halorussus halophilus]